MKRIKVRPGEHMTVSDANAAKVARAMASFELGRENAERIIADEPREATVVCSPM